MCSITAAWRDISICLRIFLNVALVLDTCRFRRTNNDDTSEMDASKNRGTEGSERTYRNKGASNSKCRERLAANVLGIWILCRYENSLMSEI